jgi:hypothetical protein
MRKTRLRKLADQYGAKECVLAPATIDSIVYMLTELGETNFGPEFVDELWPDIQLTQGEFPKKQALEIVMNGFFRHLLQALEGSGKMKPEDFAKKMRSLPELTDKSYVDYFVLFTTIENHLFNTPLQRACPNIQAVLAAYQTESPLVLCEGVVTFFRETNDVSGYKEVIKTLCDTIKAV